MFRYVNFFLALALLWSFTGCSTKYFVTGSDTVGLIKENSEKMNYHNKIKLGLKKRNTGLLQAIGESEKLLGEISSKESSLKLNKAKRQAQCSVLQTENNLNDADLIMLNNEKSKILLNMRDINQEIEKNNELLRFVEEDIRTLNETSTVTGEKIEGQDVADSLSEEETRTLWMDKVKDSKLAVENLSIIILE